MPWARIPPEKLQHLPLFGIDLIKDEGAFAWYRGACRMRVEKADPWVYFDDIADAHQAGALNIIQS